MLHITMALLRNTKAINLLCYHFLIVILISNFVFSDSDKFEFDEATIGDVQKAFQQRTLTSRQLVQYYLDKINKLNPKLRCFVEVNPDALYEAEKADQERVRFPPGHFGEMHGIPVLVRDTMATKDALNTTCGSYALLGTEVKRDAGVVEKLRKAGVVILGKSSMTEWRMRSTQIPTGWSARGGQALNPYVLESKGPCGTALGTAIGVSANLAMVGVADTSEQGLACSADYNSVVGFKPTLGLTSRSYVVGLTPRTGSVGCHARTVSDAVIVITAIAGFDPNDYEQTLKASNFIPVGGYTQFLKKDGLSGKRVGVVRYPSSEPTDDPTVSSIFERSLDVMRAGGATVLDDLKIQNLDLLMNGNRSGAFQLYLVDLKMEINEYLRRKVIRSRVWSLSDVIAFNKQVAELEKTKEYGQDNLIRADVTNRYGREEIEISNMLNRFVIEGFEKVIKEKKLDAIVAPGYELARALAIGGYPMINVPSGYNKEGVPMGVLFGGLRGFEPKLIECAYAFEQATLARKPPNTNYSS